jgi:hypothetical protein
MPVITMFNDEEVKVEQPAIAQLITLSGFGASLMLEVWVGITLFAG